jgi:hypothetical protein
MRFVTVFEWAFHRAEPEKPAVDYLPDRAEG